ncbi:MAG: hypothetical protein KZQ83_01050 [gamma proteobacterium symbiont of Taylorina sp.]|nr:hypothetical protein [gamma proteobacterium symbiont of Taylorina sp.]
MKWLFILFAICNVSFFAYSNYFSANNTARDMIVTTTSINQIKLLSEVDPGELEEIQVTGQTSNVSQQNLIKMQKIPIIDRTNKVLNNQCFKVGPINKNTMYELRIILENEYTNHISFLIETTSPITYHRIYIPPQQKQQKINEILANLEKNDLTDHYVMSIDGRKNAIALGVYKNRKTAEKIAHKVKYLGYSIIIEAITKDKNSLFNLKLEFKDNQDLSVYSQFLSSKNLKSVACKNND